MDKDFVIKKIDFDFHVHVLPGSSDSKQTVREAIEIAKKAGINHLAVTDHDSISSIKEALSLQDELDIRILPGVEFSVTVLGLGDDLDYLTIHVLGLGIIPNENNFNYLLKEVNERKEKWLTQIKAFYEKEYGVSLKSTTRSELKEELIALNIFKDKKEVSNSFKSQHDGVDQLIKISLSNIVDIIHRLSGVAIWAHPNRGENHKVISPNQIERIANYLIERGLDGMELYHPDVTSDEESFALIKRIVRENNLLTSLGSDRHNVINKYGPHYFTNHDFLKTANENFNAIKARLLKRIDEVHAQMNIKSRLYKAAKKHDEDILKHFSDESLSDRDYCYYALNEEIMSNIIRILLNVEMNNIASLGIDNSCRAIIEAISLINMLLSGKINDTQLKIFRYQYSLVEIDNYRNIFPKGDNVDKYISQDVLNDKEKVLNLYCELFNISRNELDSLIERRKLFLFDPLAFLFRTPNTKIKFEDIIKKYHPAKEEMYKIYTYFSIFDHPRYEHDLDMEKTFMNGRMTFINAVIEDTIRYFNRFRLFLHNDLSLPNARDDLFNNEYKILNSMSLNIIDELFDDLIHNFGYYENEGTDNQTIFYLDKLRAIAKDMYICKHRGQKEQLIAIFRPFAELSSVIMKLNKCDESEFRYLKTGFWYSSRLQLYSFINYELQDYDLDAINLLYEEYYKKKYQLNNFEEFVNNMRNNSLYFLDKEEKNYKRIVNGNILFTDELLINEFKSLYKISIDISHAGGYSFNASNVIVDVSALQSMIIFWQYVYEYALLQDLSLYRHGYKTDIVRTVNVIKSVINSFNEELINLIKSYK